MVGRDGQVHILCRDVVEVAMMIGLDVLGRLDEGELAVGQGRDQVVIVDVLEQLPPVVGEDLCLIIIALRFHGLVHRRAVLVGHLVHFVHAVVDYPAGHQEVRLPVDGEIVYRPEAALLDVHDGVEQIVLCRLLERFVGDA